MKFQGLEDELAMTPRELLEHSYEVERACRLRHARQEMSRLEFLSDHVFNFTTYDSAMDELFAAKAVEVCSAISRGATFDFIKDEDAYRWYLIMVNMPFFEGRLEWGSSIRGAWWDHSEHVLESCGFWRGEEQALAVVFSREEWLDFNGAMVDFVKAGRDAQAQAAAEPAASAA